VNTSGVPTNHVDILLPDFARGKLGDDDVRSVETHLHECEVCRSELEQIRRTLASIGESETLEIPGSYFSSILPRVRETIDRRNRSVWNSHPLITRVVLPTGAAVVLAALLWLMPLRNGAMGTKDSLQSVVDSASPEDIAEILQRDIPSHEWNSLGDTVLTRALRDDQFVQRQLVEEALTSGTNSPFDVFANVSPQQMLSSLDEKETAQILQQLKMVTL
jgi:hypothetical protein